jgi:riboflavin kinase / FMN adenylyltransferase
MQRVGEVVKTIPIKYPHQLKEYQLPNTVAAIGFFDGIHSGHQKVINKAVQIAKEQGKESAVITFTPHPSVVLKKEKQHVNYLTPTYEKQQILASMDVDRMYIITFNKELSTLEPQAFIDHFIIGLNITHLVAGFDFSYGHKGKGSMETLADHSRGKFEFTVVNKIQDDSDKISSTRIRQYLLDGKVEEANTLLGRNLTLRGMVVEGDKRGRTIGFPTANIKLSDSYFLPKVGVYAVHVQIDSKTFNGMANLGYKPTFNDDRVDPSIEIHIFDYNEDIYGKELTVEWKKYIRPEVKFNSIDDLINQLKQDEQTIMAYLN